MNKLLLTYFSSRKIIFYYLTVVFLFTIFYFSQPKAIEIKIFFKADNILLENINKNLNLINNFQNYILTNYYLSNEIKFNDIYFNINLLPLLDGFFYRQKTNLNLIFFFDQKNYSALNLNKLQKNKKDKNFSFLVKIKPSGKFSESEIVKYIKNKINTNDLLSFQFEDKYQNYVENQKIIQNNKYKICKKEIKNFYPFYKEFINSIYYSNNEPMLCNLIDIYKDRNKENLELFKRFDQNISFEFKKSYFYINGYLKFLTILLVMLGLINIFLFKIMKSIIK